MRQCKFSELLGKTLTGIEGLRKKSEEVKFQCSDGSEYRMYHEQDCCERVDVDDIDGDTDDVIGAPLSMAEESHSQSGDTDEGTTTWTFYRLAARGYVTIKWYGASNGYYSEHVYFECTKEARL